MEGRQGSRPGAVAAIPSPAAAVSSCVPAGWRAERAAAS